MKPTIALICAMLCTMAFAQPLTETKEQRDQRMVYWRGARFGMFIHWGLYSVTEGEWGDRKNYGEWIMETAKIPIDEYEKLKNKFNPVKFNAAEWAKMAKDAGMKYMVVTTKHHDGFALYESQVSDYDVMATPFRRDIMRELVKAVRDEGLMMGWYHSIMDWHHPEYRPARTYNPRQSAPGPVKMHLDRYNEYLRAQVSELLTNYGPVSLMWFDGEWESTWNDDYGKPLYELCRTLQPNVIVNNRVSNGRAGSMEDAGPTKIGDFSTPEQFIPATGLPGVDWETCMTMNDNWGWNRADTKWKSSRELIRNLIDVVSKGGNYLLNIGPRPDGTFPPEAISRLKDIGDWMDKYGSTIHQSEASLFEALPFGRSTTRRDDGTTYLFLYIFDWPENGTLVLPGLGSDPEKIRLLRHNMLLPWKRVESDIVITLPESSAPWETPVIEVAVKGEPIIYRSPKVTALSEILTDSTVVSMDSGSPELELRYTLDGSDPVLESTVYSSPITITATTSVKAASFHRGRRASPIATLELKKVDPSPAYTGNVAPGIACKEYKGDWDVLPDFTKLTPISRPAPTKIEPAPEEFIGRLYNGYIKAPSTGVYVFELTADDGANLWIDGKLAIDNDGLHAAVAKTATVALAAGWHPIKLGWFNKTGGYALSLRWAKAGERLADIDSQQMGH